MLTSRGRTLHAAICILALSLPKVSSAQENARICEQFGTSAATFVGQVGAPARHWMIVGPDMPPQNIPVYPVVVEQAFRGVREGSTVYLYTLDVPEKPAPGHRYLVYGAFNFGLNTEVVSPLTIMPVEKAERDLSFLSSQESRSATTGRVFGVVEQGNPFSSTDRRPLAGIKLHVKVGDFVMETLTDPDGRFDVAELPEGFFKIEPELPSQFTITHTGGGQVRAGGCVPTGVLVQWNGIIRGRVTLPDQRPMHGPVDLLPADKRNDAFDRSGQSLGSNADGEYEFTAIPPGSYLVGVNLRRQPSPGLPYDATYFPGTTVRGDAVAVHVGEGTVHDGIDFELSPALKRGRLEIRAQPSSAGVVSVCVASSGTYRQQAPGEPVGVDVVEGSPYRFWIHVEDKTSGKHWESDAVEMIGAPGVRQLTLTATKPGRPHPAGIECVDGFIPP